MPTTIAAQKDLRSVGNLCGMLQRSPDVINGAAKVLGIQPALRLNGVPHYDADQVERICTYFRESEAS